jgi:hypothetical protein
MDLTYNNLQTIAMKLLKSYKIVRKFLDSLMKANHNGYFWTEVRTKLGIKKKNSSLQIIRVWIRLDSIVQGIS